MPRKNLHFHFLGPLVRPGKLFVDFLELPLQHFRRYVRLSEWIIPKIDPGDHHAVEDRDLVRAVLNDFEEAADLLDDVREQLVADLVDAVGAWRAGIDVGKRGISNEKEAQRIFILKVERALERAGQSATRWRKTYEGDGPDRDAPESLYFRVIRAIGNVFDIFIPKDLMRPTDRASEIQYGEMSPGMKVWQAAELLAWWQRLDDLAVRLKAAQDAERAARRRRLRAVWGDHLVEPSQTCEELAAAYLGFPFGTPDSPFRLKVTTPDGPCSTSNLDGAFY